MSNLRWSGAAFCGNPDSARIQTCGRVYHRNGTGIFDDIFAKYTKKSELVRVRTVNMGSLYELCYQVDLKSEFIEKNMLDEIRCRNGNLTIVCGRLPDGRDEL